MPKRVRSLLSEVYGLAQWTVAVAVVVSVLVAGYWVFPHVDGSAQLTGLGLLCTQLQPFTSIPPTASGALVNRSLTLTDNTTVVLALRGTTTACPTGVIPVTVSDAVIVDVEDKGRTNNAYVSVGLWSTVNVPAVDCRTHR